MSDQTAAAWRLLLDEPSPGAWNMAVDEVLLDAVASGAGPPTLRFFRWRPACLSLGYFQSHQVVDIDACRAAGVEVVRRPTGGRAILHDRELTYSVTLPLRALGQDQGVLPSYHRLSRGLLEGFRMLGVPVSLAKPAVGAALSDHGPACFDRPSAHELLLFGRKLAGSAQVRRQQALLQHGSILFAPQVDSLLRCLRLDPATRERWRAEMTAGVTGLEEVGSFDSDAIAHAIASAFSRVFEAELAPATLTPREHEQARALADGKYATAAWTALH